MAVRPRIPRGEPIRVVIVDDQEMVAQTFRRILERAGMDVVAVASTIATGVAAAKEHAPDVVVVDYLLPDGLGTAAVALIREQAPGVRIVMASGSDSADSRAVALAAGCAGYVDKTRVLQTLAEVVREAAATAHGDDEGPGQALP
jgi:DNA-binding NarL/FixJ family response regulator